MLDLLVAGIVTMLQWKYMLPLLIGTIAGVVGGSLPGVTITMTVIMILPFTYGLDPLAGLAAMTGVYVGGSTGGLMTCCLIGIPGSPASIATTFDGFPMARKGEPGRAIWLGIWASVWGGLLGALFLVFLTGPLAAIALEFGPWEYFSLFVLAMAMVAGLTESSLVKGLMSTALGLLITVIGTDPIALALAALGQAAGWDTSLLAPFGPGPPAPFDVACDRRPLDQSLCSERMDAWTAVAVATHDMEVDEAALVPALASAPTPPRPSSARHA